MIRVTSMIAVWQSKGQGFDPLSSTPLNWILSSTFLLVTGGLVADVTCRFVR